MSQDNRRPAPRGNIEYGSYLRLDRLLAAQEPESGRDGAVPAHDELLFIITHQAYELWFKQILHELESVCEAFSGERLEDRALGVVNRRLGRVRAIQDLLLLQIDVLETMTPLDFLDFRDLLVPASGFQSIQFKLIEIALGLRFGDRTTQDQDFFRSRLNEEQRSRLDAASARPTLLDLTARWLGRMPFARHGEFDFWEEYRKAAEGVLQAEQSIVESSPALSETRREVQLRTQAGTSQRFAAILDAELYQRLQEQGQFRLPHAAFRAALFIHLYRDEPVLHAPFQYLTHLLEIDEAMTRWRTRHAMMVHRMLGARIGTGGSSGHDYLNDTARRNRVWTDLFNLSTFLIPRSRLPALPVELVRDLGFRFS